MIIRAQKFMNEQGIEKCYECDGKLFKHEENAKGRSEMNGAAIVTHELSAGAKTTADETQP